MSGKKHRFFWQNSFSTPREVENFQFTIKYREDLTNCQVWEAESGRHLLFLTFDSHLRAGFSCILTKPLSVIRAFWKTLAAAARSRCQRVDVCLGSTMMSISSIKPKACLGESQPQSTLDTVQKYSERGGGEGSFRVFLPPWWHEGQIRSKV